MWKRNLSVTKRFCIVFAAVLCLSVLGGCAKEVNEPQETSHLSQEETGVTFTDALDREVTVLKNPERVAALIGSFADGWLLAGGTVCAAPEDAWDDLASELTDAVSLGGAHSPSLETLLAADPDFVLASASTEADVELKDALEAAGIPVAYFDVDDFDDYLAMLRICTDITGRDDLYEKNGTAVQTQIETVKKEFAGANLPESERTVLLIRTSASSVKAKGSSGTVLGEMLRDLGCINIADSDETLLENLSVESVIRQEPYRIFVVTMGDDTDKAMENLNRMMDENPVWGELEAVKENRFHVMDKKLFNNKPNAKWAQAYEQLCDILLEK